MQVKTIEELEAVNTIIGSIGSPPINSLDHLQNVDAINALRILRTTSRLEQARGWSFNIISPFVLNPDVYTKKIPYLSNYLYIKGLNDEKYINAGGFLKNLKTGQISFDSPIQVEMILEVPFEQLPLPMRTYIIAKSSYLFQNRYFGDSSLTETLASEIAEAWQYLNTYEIDNNNYNMLQNTNVQEVLSR